MVPVPGGGGCAQDVRGLEEGFSGCESTSDEEVDGGGGMGTTQDGVRGTKGKGLNALVAYQPAVRTRSQK